MEIKVMRVGSDTFGDPFIQKVLQNQPSSPYYKGPWDALPVVAKCENWTFKLNFLCQKLSESFSFFFIEEYQFSKMMPNF